MIVKAPHPYPEMPWLPKLFLAGSIEMGKAVDWQKSVEEAVTKIAGDDVTVLNPRRDDWDSSWKQAADNAPFREQVEWELRAQKEADLIVMYFQPGTQSPITLLELGLFHDKKLVVCCPEGFWRKGNVDIVCQNYGIEQVETLEELIEYVREWTREQVS